jgi:tetratricopeptide (TPR) repeat protein
MLIQETHFLLAIREAVETTMIRGVLEKLGCKRVDVFANGPDALRAAQAKPYYFVIASWELPGLGGLRLVREVRWKAASARRPCLLILPEHNDSERNLAENVEITDFLVRPLTPEKISDRILEVLEGGTAGHWPDQQLEAADRLVREGHPEEALLQYQQLADTGRDQLADLHTDLGLALNKAGRMTEAIDNLEQAALLVPGRARAHLALGQVYLQAGRPAEALRAVERAVGLQPDNEEAQRHLADSLLENDRPARAEALFQSLLAKNPNDSHLLNRLGMALRKQGKFREAVAHYSKALKINDRDENLFFNLGRCHLEIGQTEAAIIVLNQALNLNPGFEEARQLLARIVAKS